MGHPLVPIGARSALLPSKHRWRGWQPGMAKGGADGTSLGWTYRRACPVNPWVVRWYGGRKAPLYLIHVATHGAAPVLNTDQGVYQ